MNLKKITTVIALIAILATSAFAELKYFKGENGKWGYKDENGTVVIAPKYDDAEKFSSNGFAIVMGSDEKYGIINSKGEKVTPLVYDAIGAISANGIISAKLNKKWGAVNTGGKDVIPFKYDALYGFVSDLAGFELNGKCGFINTKDEVIIPAKYDGVGSFSNNGLANVKLKKTGFINAKDEIIIPFIYDFAFPFNNNGIAEVLLNGKWGLLGKNGNHIEPKYDNMPRFGEIGFGDLAIVKQNGKYGMINTDLKEVIPIKYNHIGANGFCENGLISVCYNDKCGFVDKKNQIIIPLKYDKVGECREGVMQVSLKPLHGAVDINNRLIVPISYDALAIKPIIENLRLEYHNKKETSIITTAQEIKSSQSDTNSTTAILKEYNYNDIITDKDGISYIASTKELLTGVMVVPYKRGGKLEAYIPMKNGKWHGHAVWCDYDGTKEREMDYVNNQKHGLLIEYDELGNLESKTRYEYGLKNGLYQYFDTFNHCILKEVPYASNLENGIQKKYYRHYSYDCKTTKLNSETPYTHGVINGIVKTYYSDGLVKSITTFKHGRENGIKKAYDTNGAITTDRIYSDGDLVRDFVAEREKIAAAKRAKQEAIAAAKRAKYNSYSSSSSSSPSFVIVNLDFTCGFGGCLTKSLNVSGGNGVNIVNNGKYSSIHPGYNRSLAGTYQWSGSSDNGKYCSGSFHISGTKQNYTIRVYDNCKDASSGEF